LQVGDYELVSLVDTWGTLGNLEDLFAGVPPEAWAPYRTRYPKLFLGAEWRPPFGCFLVRSADLTMVIDAGVGPAGGSFLPQAEGRLPAVLASSGVAPSDVDLCVLTHLHIDHVGWVATEGHPTWPQARYVASREDWAWAKSREAAERDRVFDRLTPVARAGNLMLIDGEETLAPGIRVVPTPGHTPGHCSIRISSKDAEAIVLGDVGVHPAQLSHPEWAYLFDVEPGAAAATRRALLDGLANEQMIVACGHYPGGIGRMVSHEGRPVWVAVSEQT
jgi:glyoxylase-like metal-dependent hydrolase (beta-lactamase superfamily II)